MWTRTHLQRSPRTPRIYFPRSISVTPARISTWNQPHGNEVWRYIVLKTPSGWSTWIQWLPSNSTTCIFGNIFSITGKCLGLIYPLWLPRMNKAGLSNCGQSSSVHSSGKPPNLGRESESISIGTRNVNGEVGNKFVRRNCRIPLFYASIVGLEGG